MKKFIAPNGETHYFVEESEFLYRIGHTKYFDESEIKKTTRLEASKLLFLARIEWLIAFEDDNLPFSAALFLSAQSKQPRWTSQNSPYRRMVNKNGV